MKTAIKLILIYMLFQILAAFLVYIPCLVISLVKYGNMDQASGMLLVPTMLVSMLGMGIYLWKKHYIPSMRTTWSAVSPVYLIFTVIITLATVCLLDALMSQLTWLPDWTNETIQFMLSNWPGILCVTVFAPILEELMFRGAITSVLLRKYSPTKAIIISALIFGIFHFNPVQSVGATFIGLLLAWMYYKTGSLIPGILAHILNNSLAVYLNLKYPEAAYMEEITGAKMYYILMAVAAVLLVVSYLYMKRVTLVPDWKETDTKVELTKE